jgi:RimJ/RimL family protein N-acetyltransferase
MRVISASSQPVYIELPCLFTAYTLFPSGAYDDNLRFMSADSAKPEWTALADYSARRRRISVSRVRSQFVTTTLVFECFASRNGGKSRDICEDGQWQIADPGSIRSLFAGDQRLGDRFQSFLAEGCVGVILVRDGQWISYGWCAQPERGNPPHLPGWVRTLRAYWIFYCHTKEGFRGRGIYKQLLKRHQMLAFEKQPGAAIYADAYPENCASRRAILSAGFSPRGLFTTYKLWIPRIGKFVLAGSWRREEPHPCVSSGDGILL